jgi:hypothetical protein
MTHIARSLNPLLDARDAEAELLLARAVIRWRGATKSEVIDAGAVLLERGDLADRTDARIAFLGLKIGMALQPRRTDGIAFWAGLAAMAFMVGAILQGAV